MAGIKITGKDMLEKYEEFLNDDTNIKLAQKNIVRLFRPEILVEVFVADFHEKSNLILDGQTDVYKRYTSIARVLRVSDACESPYDELSPGDIVAVEDQITGQILNPKWESWSKVKNSPNLVSSEPMRVIRGIDAWIDRYFFALEKGDHAMDMRRMYNLNKEIDKFHGPYTFLVPVSKIGPQMDAEAVKEQILNFEGESKAIQPDKKTKQRVVVPEQRILT